MAPAQCSHFYSLHHSYNSAKCKCATHYEHHNSHRGFIKRKRVEVEEMLEALGPEAGFIGIPRKIMALKNLKAIIIDLNYIKGILFFLDLTGE